MITAVSLECGYPASSIRERIYAIPDALPSILLKCLARGLRHPSSS